MDALKVFFGIVSNYTYGALIPLLIGVGVILSIRLSYLPIRRIGYGFRLLFQRQAPKGAGDISPFGALMTALSATIGVGNIVGVSLAVTWGGPGALFWMWVSALVGLATKYSESVLAVHFREVDDYGMRIGGPMYYIKNGLGKRWRPLALAFAFFGGIAAFGIGNMTQGNAIASALSNYQISPVIVSVVLTLVVGMVILGGIRRIAKWATFLVPFFAVLYLLIGLIVIVAHVDRIPAVLGQIISSAFTGTAATGGFVGSAVWAAIRFGVARGIFSNEAGLGSASIAHAAAATNDPVRQGTIAMLGTFIDTIVVCSITGFIILLTGARETHPELYGADLVMKGLSTVLPGANHIVAGGLVVFGFTTILGWSYYGEKCCQYIFGEKSIRYYRLAFSLAILVGPLALVMGEGQRVGVESVWLVSEIFCALMAVPNLIALFFLAPVVVALTSAYYQHGKVPDSG